MTKTLHPGRLPVHRHHVPAGHAGLLTYLLGTSGLALALGIGAVVVATGIPRGSAIATMLHLGAIPLDARRAPWHAGRRRAAGDRCAAGVA